MSEELIQEVERRLNEDHAPHSIRIDRVPVVEERYLSHSIYVDEELSSVKYTKLLLDESEKELTQSLDVITEMTSMMSWYIGKYIEQKQCPFDWLAYDTINSLIKTIYHEYTPQTIELQSVSMNGEYCRLVFLIDNAKHIIDSENEFVFVGNQARDIYNEDFIDSINNDQDRIVSEINNMIGLRIYYETVYVKR